MAIFKNPEYEVSGSVNNNNNNKKKPWTQENGVFRENCAF